MIYTCSECAVKSCTNHGKTPYPANCPCRDQETTAQAIAKTKEPETFAIAQKAAEVEKEGYCQLTRIQEIALFCKKMGYQTIGIAFCIGLQNECKVVAKYFRQQGLTVHTVCCKCSSVNKEDVGLPSMEPAGTFEAMCNPAGQAMFLAKAGTELNVILGLCVGHDTIFLQNTKAPVTVLAAKDRVLGHNPLAAVYTSQSYYQKKLFPGEK